MRKTIRGIFLLYCALMASAFPCPLLAADREVGERIDAYLQPYLEIGHLSGTNLLAMDDAVLYHRSFGLADQELNVTNTPDTRFGVRSVNKPMTIVILARLIEEGWVKLSDPIAQYAPAFPRGEDMTVEHLLNHSSGIAHRVTSELDEIKPQTAASMRALAATSGRVFEPGSDSVYSSAGFSVLQEWRQQLDPNRRHAAVVMLGSYRHASHLAQFSRPHFEEPQRSSNSRTSVRSSWDAIAFKSMA